jgi:hypothetical protein
MGSAVINNYVMQIARFCKKYNKLHLLKIKSKGKSSDKFDEIAEQISFNDHSGGNSFGAKNGKGVI